MLSRTRKSKSETSEVYHSFVQGKEWKRSLREGRGMGTDGTRGCELQRACLPAWLRKRSRAHRAMASQDLHRVGEPDRLASRSTSQSSPFK